MTFENLHLIPQILQSLKAKGYTIPTAIQHKAIPHILAKKDIFGMAQTGTGKTAAFALPILQLLFNNKSHEHHKKIRALILAPTRELAHQISDSFFNYGKGLHLKQTVIYGGVKLNPQIKALRSGVDILIATPGRLIDMINQGHANLQGIEFFVLDEVDRMLDMGFIHDIKRIISKLPQKKQTLLFSATLPTEIKKLADGLLHEPVTVAVDKISSASTNVKQYVYFVPRENKKNLLKHILSTTPNYHILIFMRTKRNVDRLSKNLFAMGLKTEAIHGDKSQSTRQRALQLFKSRKINILIATDVASRGLDVTEITHVINYDLPEEAESYIHRIGRTGRAGASGIAISFCSNDEKQILKEIYKLSENKIETVPTPAFAQETVVETQAEKPKHSHTPHHKKQNDSHSHPKREHPSNSNHFAKKKSFSTEHEKPKHSHTPHHKKRNDDFSHSKRENFSRSRREHSSFNEKPKHSHTPHHKKNNESHAHPKAEHTSDLKQEHSKKEKPHDKKKFFDRKKKWQNKWHGKRNKHSRHK